MKYEYLVNYTYGAVDSYQNLIFGKGVRMEDKVAFDDASEKMHYGFDEYHLKPFTFKLIDNGKFSFSKAGMRYSVNGSSPVTLGANEQTPTLNSGDTVYWYFSGSPTTTDGIGTFSSTGRFDVEGNLLSLLWGTDFIENVYTYVWEAKGDYPPNINVSYAFKYLLKGTKVVNAYRLCLSFNQGDQATGAKGLFYGMFENCNYLEIPMLTWSESGLWEEQFAYTYANCTSLKTTMKNIRGQGLAYRTCFGMYSGCTSLIEAETPVVGTITNSGCMDFMFDGCTNLRKITTHFTTQPQSGYTTNWVRNVYPIGVYVRPKSCRWDSVGVNSVPEGWTMMDDEGNVVPHYKDMYLTLEAVSSTTFAFNGGATYYSTNNGNSWTSLSSGSYTPTISAGSKVLFKGAVSSGSFSSSSGKFKVYGNVLSMKYGDNFKGKTELNSSTGALSQLFMGAQVTDAEYLILPETVSVASGLSRMFWGCTLLTTAPKNISSDISDYCCYEMFAGCASLTNAPKLPATTIASRCYSHMFEGCTSLITAPTLRAETISGACYEYMFKDCTALTSIYVNAKEAVYTTFTTDGPTYQWVSGISTQGTFNWFISGQYSSTIESYWKDGTVGYANGGKPGNWTPSPLW